MHAVKVMAALCVLGCFGLLRTPSLAAQENIYVEGLHDRNDYELWSATLSGDVKDGAAFWAGERSKTHPMGCSILAESRSSKWTFGCKSAQEHLAASDARRRTEPIYRQGWNAYRAPLTETVQPGALQLRSAILPASIADAATTNKSTTNLSNSVFANKKEDACKGFDAQSIINRAGVDKNYKLTELTNEHPQAWAFERDHVSLWLCDGTAKLVLLESGQVSDWKFSLRPKGPNGRQTIEIYQGGTGFEGATAIYPEASSVSAGDRDLHWHSSQETRFRVRGPSAAGCTQSFPAMIALQLDLSDLTHNQQIHLEQAGCRLFPAGVILTWLHKVQPNGAVLMHRDGAEHDFPELWFNPALLEDKDGIAPGYVEDR